ncbi:20224_t:CDS:2, partial [Racocetra persica]
QTFDDLVKEYIESLAPNKREKVLIDQEKLQRIKKVLLDSMNTTQYISAFYYWVKKKFKLQQNGDSYIVLHIQIQNKKNNEKVKIELPMLAVENMYKEFCKIHATIIQHSSQKETWNQATFNSSIINERSKHSASQGLVEQANRILETKLGKWMKDNKYQNWSFGLRFVIYIMNSLICKAHNKKPYELVFGETLY